MSERKVNLKDVFPIHSIEDGYIVSKTGDVSIAYELELPPIFTVSDSKYSQLLSVWTKALRVLPYPCIVHKQDFYYTDHYKAEHKSGEDFFDEAYQKHFNGRIFLNHKCFVYFTRTSKNRISSSGLGSFLFKRGGVFPKTEKDEIEKFIEGVDQAISIINDSKLLSFRRLDNDDLVGSKNTDVGLFDRLFMCGEDCLGDVYFGEKLEEKMRIGDNLLSIHSVSELSYLPDEVDLQKPYSRYCTEESEMMISFMSPVGISLRYPHIYNQYVFLSDPNDHKSYLEKKQKQLTAMAQLSPENAVNAELCADFLYDIRATGALPVEAHANIITWASTTAELKAINEQVVSSLSNADVRCKRVGLDIPTLFWASIPGNAGDLPHEELFRTGLEQALCFFVFETNYRTSKSNFYINLSDRLTGIPVKVDISDEPMRNGTILNMNKFILGPSGSGKSFFTNHLVRQYYEKDAHVLLVDVGHSYENLCHYINEKTNGEDGIYYTYKEDEPISFNPFYTENGVYDLYKRNSLYAIISFLWLGSRIPTQTEHNLLKQSIIKYIKKIRLDGSEANFNGYYRYMRSEFRSELKEKEIKVKTSDFDLDNFLTTLEVYYEGGEYDYLLNAKENIDLLNKRFVVFEIDAIKGDPILFPLTTIIIMDAYLNKIKKLDGRKVLVIEEAWKAIMSDTFAVYIKEVYKTVRKHGGEAIVVTQELDDLLGSDIVKESIITQSDCVILLDMKDYHARFEQIQAFLGLSDHECQQIFSINVANDYSGRNLFREVFISLGGKVSTVYAVEVSTEEALAFSTTAHVKSELLKLQAKGLSVVESIQKYMSDK